MLIMEHLCVVCVIEGVLTTFTKLKLFAHQYKKQLIFGPQCFMVSFLDKLVLDLALKLLEISLSLIFGFHFPNLL